MHEELQEQALSNTFQNNVIIKWIQHLQLGPLTSIIDGRVTLVGVNSFVMSTDTENCSLSFPDYFANVAQVSQWILRNTDAGLYQCLSPQGNVNCEHFSFCKFHLLLR